LEKRCTGVVFQGRILRVYLGQVREWLVLLLANRIRA